MRRKDREVTDFSEIADIISRCTVCTVALSDDEYPYVLPLNFGSEISDGQVTLYFHGAGTGRKHELIAKNNRAGFTMTADSEIVDTGGGKYTTLFESIIGTGTFDYVEEPDEKQRALRLLFRQFGMVLPDNHIFDPELVSVTSVMRLRVDSLSCKRSQKPAPKTP